MHFYEYKLTFIQFIFIIHLVKPSDLIILTLIGVGVNVLDFGGKEQRDKRQKH